MHYAISYVSTASRDLDQSEVVEILDQTEVRNNQMGIHGLLIYSEGNFFEVLEGDRHVVLDLFNSIKQDERHKNIISIFEKPVKEKLFDPGDGYFISANTRYRKMKVENFYKCIKDLDESTQKVVNQIIAQIGKNSPLEESE
jgi:hypothetical protein